LIISIGNKETDIKTMSLRSVTVFNKHKLKMYGKVIMQVPIL